MVSPEKALISGVIWLFVYVHFNMAQLNTDKVLYKLVSGLQLEQVPSPSSQFYKEYVPLVYQFTIPRWSKNNTVIYGSQGCNTTNYSKFFTTCPVLYYLKDIHERFSEYLGESQPLVATLEEIGAKPETALIPFDCELIRPHFDDVYMDKVVIDEYLSRLKSCTALGSQEFLKGFTNYVYNISGIYLEMRRNFYNEFWLKIDLIDGRVDAAIWVNAISTLNSLLFQNHMMEANRWKMAVVDCEAGRIPSTILPPSLVSDTLTDMLESLPSLNLVPTVSNDTIGNYYKSTLTDCTFTNDTFLVRILIPVIPKTEKFLLVKMAPLPFYYRDPETQTNMQCQVDPEVLPQVGSGEGETYVLVDLVKNIAYESDCKPGKLCHIPSILHPRKISLCATAAFNWDRYKSNDDSVRKDLVTHCPITCSPVNKFKKDILKQISPTDFFWFYGDITMPKATSIVTNCPFRTVETADKNNGMQVVQKPVLYGAQSVSVPCGCMLSYESQVYKPKPCRGLEQSDKRLISINYLAPIHWYSENALKQNRIKLWNVPEDFFKNPNANLIQQSIRRLGRGTQFGVNPEEDLSKSPSMFVIFLSFVCIALVIMVGALAWRIHALIAQLQELGFNVKGNSSYNFMGSTGLGEQQVSYRNMNSSTDADNSLLINEGN